MTSPAAAIAQLPERFNTRMGTVTVSTTGRLVVNVAGGDVVNPGSLNGLQPPVGARVLMLRQDATWCCLGTIMAPGTGGQTLTAAKAVADTTGTLCNNGATTFIGYQSVPFDTAGGFDLATVADSYTVQYDGIYFANAGAALPAGTGQRTNALRRNGTAFNGSTTIVQATAAGSIDFMTQVVIDIFHRGDTISQTVVQNSGGPLTTLTAAANLAFLQVFRLGDIP
jgi:hypothetical protein